MVAAAEDLGVSHGAVSRQITRLEGIVGQPLFERTARGLVLTQAGQSLAASARDGFQRVRSGLDLLRADDRRSIRLLAPPNLSLRWIGPRLSRLAAAIAPARLDIAAQNLDDPSGDVVLRWYAGQPLPAGGTVLFGDDAFPVASPAMAARIKDASDLKKEPRIGFASSPDWSCWARAVGLSPEALKPTVVVSDTSIALEAAAAGDGVAMARLPLVLSDLQSGRLVICPGPVVPTGGAYVLMAPTPRPGSMLAQRLSAELIRMAAETVEQGRSLLP